MSYKITFEGLGTVEFEITNELSQQNCGVRSICRIKCIGDETKLCKEFYKYIRTGVSDYKYRFDTYNGDPFWDYYENMSMRAIYLLTGAVNNDGSPYRYSNLSTMQFCHINQLPHFDMMVNPVHPERKSAVYALCVGYKKRGAI